jgi:hypothetical protein
VVIFNATINDISTTCKAGNDSSLVNFECNAYVPANFTAATTSFGGTIGKLDATWPPQSRTVSQTLGPSYVGIYVKIHRALMTAQFGTTIPTISGSAIMRLEPK